MKIVIDIPENVIEDAKSSPNYYSVYHFEKIWKAIVNGTPLPKGHGELIDRNDLKYEKYNSYAYAIANAPTIIEADKEEQNE